MTPFPPDPAQSARWAAQLASSLGRDLNAPPAAAKLEPAFPHEYRDEPVTAMKQAYILTTANAVRFASLTNHDSGSPSVYGAKDVAKCHCGADNLFALGGLTISYAALVGATSYEPEQKAPQHERPTKDSACGFYAWSDTEPMPWEEGAWLLEVDLYGFVIEHDRGFRAEKQRVLSISPVLPLLCGPPFRLVCRDSKVRAVCDQCPQQKKDHPVTIDRVRRFLNVEIDLERAWRLREAEPALAGH